MQDATHPSLQVPSSSGTQLSTGSLIFLYNISHMKVNNYVRDVVILERIVTEICPLFPLDSGNDLRLIDLFVCLCCRWRDAGTHLQAQ
jgi:hypothetical protein